MDAGISDGAAVVQSDGELSADSGVSSDATKQPPGVILAEGGVPACTQDAGASMNKRFFVTSKVYQGDLGFGGDGGGVAYADGICASLAQSAGLGGCWMAWLGDGTVDVDDRFPFDGPWFNLKGGMVVDSTKRTPAAEWPFNVSSSERTDESGASVMGYAWTGSGANGGTVPDHCSRWTTALGEDGGGNARRGRRGKAVPGAGSTMISDVSSGCDSEYHLYCFEQ